MFKKLIEHFENKFPQKASKRESKNKKAIIEAEIGYYSLISPALLNDTIEYDDDSEDDLNGNILII